MERYRGAISYLINKRKVGVIASVLLFILFLAPVFGAGVELIPTMDQGSITVNVSMPLGSELEETAQISDRVVDIARNNLPELDYVYYEATSEASTIYLYLLPLKDRDRSSEEVGNHLRGLVSDIAGCKISVSAGDYMSMMTGDDIYIELSGSDYDELKKISEDLIARIAALPDALNVTSSIKEEVPQVNITLNRENATRFGLTAATIGQAVRSELTGTSATELRIGGTEMSVSVKGDKLSSKSLDNLKDLSIPTPAGGAVPLSLVASVDVKLAPQTISRSNQARVVTITGSSLSGDTNKITREIQAIIDNYGIPEGYFAEMGGAYENMQESFTTLGYALLIAAGLVYFVLASQFESILMPVIIMMIIPLSFAGALFGLPVTGQKFSIVSIIGIIILAGVVVNSSIILVDYTNTRRRRGEDKNTAILNACPRRVRPVLMTTTTPGFGLMPMALSQGEGSELMIPMAVVMIFGMVVSTAVALFLTPVYYSLLDSLSERFRSKKKKKKRLREDPDCAAELSDGTAADTKSSAVQETITCRKQERMNPQPEDSHEEDETQISTK
jgi:HAE1 family hydrophobic/amphiphilic exporter-1